MCLNAFVSTLQQFSDVRSELLLHEVPVVDSRLCSCSSFTQEEFSRNITKMLLKLTANLGLTK